MLTISIHKGNANQNHTKIPPHLCYNSHHQKNHQQYVLARMWGKRNPHTLLVGMQPSVGYSHPLLLLLNSLSL
jgi:hypothetical protein